MKVGDSALGKLADSTLRDFESYIDKTSVTVITIFYILNFIIN